MTTIATSERKIAHPIETPKSIQEAIERKSVLLEEIDDIQLQLGNADTKSAGFPVWRKKAAAACRIKLREYRYLGNWIKKSRNESILSRPSLPLDSKNPITFLREAYLILTTLHNDGVALKNKEKHFLAALRNLLEETK